MVEPISNPTFKINPSFLFNSLSLTKNINKIRDKEKNESQKNFLNIDINAENSRVFMSAKIFNKKPAKKLRRFFIFKNDRVKSP